MTIVIGFVIAGILSLYVKANVPQTTGIFEVLNDARDRLESRGAELSRLREEERAYERQLENPLEEQENNIKW